MPEHQSSGQTSSARPGIAVVVKENGDFWIVHDRLFEEPPSWAEFYPDERRLVLISETGRAVQVDCELSAEALRRLQQSKTAFLIYMRDGAILEQVSDIPAVVHIEIK